MSYPIPMSYDEHIVFENEGLKRDVKNLKDKSEENDRTIKRLEANKESLKKECDRLRKELIESSVYSEHLNRKIKDFVVQKWYDDKDMYRE
jgi:septal ring factor EnvC (AmiA/AmiB activator)